MVEVGFERLVLQDTFYSPQIHWNIVMNSVRNVQIVPAHILRSDGAFRSTPTYTGSCVLRICLSAVWTSTETGVPLI